MNCSRFALVILVLCSKLFSQTYLGGNIVSDSTWDISGSPYVLTNHINIHGATLTIESGVEVQTNGFGIGIHPAVIENVPKDGLLNADNVTFVNQHNAFYP